jgi:hypothetical protein
MRAQAAVAVPTLLTHVSEQLGNVTARATSAVDKTTRSIAMAQVRPAARGLEPYLALAKELIDKPLHWWERWHVAPAQLAEWKEARKGAWRGCYCRCKCGASAALCLSVAAWFNLGFQVACHRLRRSFQPEARVILPLSCVLVSCSCRGKTARGIEASGGDNSQVVCL